MNKKFIAKASRWLHIYLSMFSFVIVLFFSITGLTLNHADYFQNKTTVTNTKGKLNVQWVNATDTLQIKKLEIVEFFRNTYKVKGAVADFIIDGSEISFSYKAPGYEADVFITKEDGSYTLTQTSQGFIGFLNDLHKGRDSGKTWSYIIDISAILLILISVSGLVLLVFLKKKRIDGFLLILVGGAILYFAYHFWGQ
jgi:hypothetical protein